MNAGEFFAEARARFEKGYERPRVRQYRIADKVVRVQYGSDEFAAAVLPALDHLSCEVNDGTADLTIRAWSGHPQITPPWPTSAYGARGEVVGFNDARYRTAFNQDAGVLSLFDGERSAAIWWTADTKTLPVYERAAPFRTLLSWWAEARGALALHGAAVATAEGEGIILAGPGGAGKSTTAVACLHAGWSYLGDDYVLVTTSDSPRIFSLYNTAKIGENAPVKISGLGSAIAHEEGKNVFQLSSGHRVAATARCRLILLPRVTPGARCRVEPMTTAEALRAIAPSTMFQVPGSGALAFRRIGELLQRVPVGRLIAGADIDNIDAVMHDALAHA